MRATGDLRPVLVAAALCVVVLLSSCGPEAEPVELIVPGDRVDGYAYTAVLVTRHPLWGALERLEQALYELSDEEWDPVLEPAIRRFEQVVFFESYALADPRERLAVLRSDWRASYPPLQLNYDELSADLLARIEWERDRADEMVVRQVAAAEALESARLARIRTRLVQMYQERLTNLAIDIEIRDAETAAAAERERERVWEVIEAEVEAERRAGLELLAALEAELRREARGRVQQARDRAGQTLARREREMERAGEDLYAEMIAHMERPWPDTGEGAATVIVESDEANVMLDVAESIRQQAEEARRAKIELQRERHLQALARLRVQLKAGTESAATVVAYRRGIDLHLLPGEPARGANYTGVIARDLEAFWGFGADQRS